MIILDISHWQTKIDWDKIKDPVILKCTESTNYLDPTFKERREILRKKGLYLGCYHFFRDVDVKQQAEWFLSHNHKDNELLILDFEINCTNPVNKCQQFLDKIKSRWLYTNEARFLNYKWPQDWDYWIAKYGTNNGSIQTPPQGDWKIWQFTSRGKYAAIAGNVDLSHTPLSLPELCKITQPSSISDLTDAILKPIITKYSQNDPSWKNYKLGYSTLKMSSYGCTTSAICTLASWFGDKITPGQLCRQGFCYTNGGLIIWKQLENVFSKIKFLYRYYSFKEEIVDEYLVKNPDTAVLLNVDKGYHWVAALSKTKTGYKCSDPYPYPSKIRTYKMSDIEGFAVLIKK